MNTFLSRLCILCIVFFGSYGVSFSYFEDELEGVSITFTQYDAGSNFYTIFGGWAVEQMRHDFHTAAVQAGDTQMKSYFTQLDSIFTAKKDDIEWLEWLMDRVEPLIQSKLQVYRETPHELTKKDKRLLVLTSYIYMSADIVLSEDEYIAEKNVQEVSTTNYTLTVPDEWGQVEGVEGIDLMLVSPKGSSFTVVELDDKYYEETQAELDELEDVGGTYEIPGFTFISAEKQHIIEKNIVVHYYEGELVDMLQVFMIHGGKLYVIGLGYVDSIEYTTLIEMLYTIEF